MAHNTSSDSDNEISTRTKLFEHEKPIHEILGGGKVADILLWRDRNESAKLFLAMTVIWFLFEILEYNLVTIICRFFITVMLALFIWFKLAYILEWKDPPHVPEIILQESFFNDLALILYKRFNQILPLLFLLTCLSHLPVFLMIIVSLYVVSVIGSYFSFINLLYIGYLCMQTLPIVFERFVFIGGSLGIKGHEIYH
ncbi:reticulon-like protein B9 isoform X2 [Lathyrus oleraceus]|uniref:reticulon-like protein B9 isoform X2 n=1 Tax=Pisum sativum TaxID=3888 RepID=UPI0021D1D397|nr:reticulon-like protein B9 isoform X2 [Pisum sativum]